jgi:hypothetical protein
VMPAAAASVNATPMPAAIRVLRFMNVGSRWSRLRHEDAFEIIAAECIERAVRNCTMSGDAHFVTQSGIAARETVRHKKKKKKAPGRRCLRRRSRSHSRPRGARRPAPRALPGSGLPAWSRELWALAMPLALDGIVANDARPPSCVLPSHPKPGGSLPWRRPFSRVFESGSILRGRVRAFTGPDRSPFSIVREDQRSISRCSCQPRSPGRSCGNLAARMLTR